MSGDNKSIGAVVAGTGQQQNARRFDFFQEMLLNPFRRGLTRVFHQDFFRKTGRLLTGPINILAFGRSRDSHDSIINDPSLDVFLFEYIFKVNSVHDDGRKGVVCHSFLDLYQ